MLNQYTVDKWLRYATKLLDKELIPSSNLDSQLILSHVTKLSKEQILTHPEIKLNVLTVLRLNQLLRKRANHRPLPYLTRAKEFYGINFYVNGDVLIPRPESEAFIDLCKSLKFSKTQSLLDIGTGSGILALTIKNEFPSWSVTGVDISEKALRVAKKNSEQLGIDIKLIKSDLLKNISGNFSILFANLPYVPKDLVTSQEISAEPRIALFSGKDGLDLYKRLFADNKIYSGTMLFVESLIDQQAEIDKIAKENKFIFVDRRDLVSVYKKI